MSVLALAGPGVLVEFINLCQLYYLLYKMEMTLVADTLGSL